MIGKTISQYKIFEKLGSGGMGDVYKAEDTKLQRIVALKFLPAGMTRDEEAQQRFMHEARTASALDHPNIGTIYEINQDEGYSFIAMAYYKGNTLKDKIESNEAGIEIEDSLDIASQIANGLTRAHSKEIVHRDIKPANILMTEDEQVKIIDFGLAKLKGHTKLTKTGSTMGTAAYMSPEQAQGTEADHRSDIWSLGVMLYEMLVGKKPFEGEYEQAIMYQIINEEPEFITKVRSNMPVQVEKIINKALAKNPDNRYQTMEEMLNDLNNVTAEIKQGDSQTASIFKLGRKQRRLAFRILAAFIILTVFGIYIWQSEQAKAEPVSIALMPLKSLTNDTEQEWLTESMTDAMITDLAKISGLRIISRSSAMAYKGTEKTPPEIASELNIQYLIEGSIVKMGDQIKISARLIDAPNNEYLWAEQYESEFTAILALQGEIAQSIAGQVQIELTPQEESLLAVSRKVDPETHELYLKGMYHLNKYTPDGFAKGLGYLHQAVEKDPKEALAHAGLALGYDMLAHTPSPPPDALPNAKLFTAKAMELDENLAEVHLADGMNKIFSDWDWREAKLSYERAIKLNPSLAMAHAQYGFLLIIDRFADEGIAELYLAQKYDPLSPIFPAWQSWIYFWLDRNDEAIKEAHKSLELLSDFPIALYTLGCAYAANGMYDEAIVTHQKVAAIGMDWKWSLGQTYALAGRKEEALSVAVELESQPNAWYTWGLAEIYTALHDKDKAFYWLEEAFKQRHAYMQWLKINPSFKYLRDDPRFEDLAKRLNLAK